MIQILYRLVLVACVCALSMAATADSSDWEISELGFVDSIQVEMPGTRRTGEYILHEALMRFTELVMSELRYQEQLRLDAEHQRQLSYFESQQDAYERARRWRAWNLFSYIFPFLFPDLEPPPVPEAEQSELFDEEQFRQRQIDYLKNFMGVCPEARKGYVYFRQRHIKTSCFGDIEAAVDYFKAYPYRLTTEFDRDAVNAAVLKITGLPLVSTPVPEPVPAAEPAPQPEAELEEVAAASKAPTAPRITPASTCEGKARNRMLRLLLEQGNHVLAYQLVIDYVDLILAQEKPDGSSGFASVDAFFDELFPSVPGQQRESVLDKLREHEVAAGRDGTQSEGVYYGQSGADADAGPRTVLNVQVLDRQSEFERMTIAMGWMAAALDNEQALRRKIQGFDDLANNSQQLLARALRSDDTALRRSLLQRVRADAGLELDTLLQNMRRDTRGYERACLAVATRNSGNPAEQFPGHTAVKAVIDHLDSVDGGRALKQRNPVLGRGR